MEVSPWSRKVKKQDFHAIHGLVDKTIAMTKLANIRDKEILQELNQNNESTKIHVNESVFSHYRKSLGKCNSLLKQ